MKKIAREHYQTLAVFCADYHSGQWSRGYRMLCRLQGYLQAPYASQWHFDVCRSTPEYAWLVSNYENKI